MLAPTVLRGGAAEAIGERIELATFRFVAQHLNHCATAVPEKRMDKTEIQESLCALYFSPNIIRMTKNRRVIGVVMSYARAIHVYRNLVEQPGRTRPH